MEPIQNEFLDTSEFFESEDLEDVGSEFTDITPFNRDIVDPERSLCQLYRARRFGQWWMLKCVGADVAVKARVVEILRKEFAIGVSLWHPNIVRMISMQHDLVDGSPGIVMEYVDGRTLYDYLERKPPLEYRIRIAEQIISAMQYYMGKQVVHCDLKPANILITHNGSNVKIIDFGLSDLDSYNVFKGHAGTDIYAAPEQMRSDGVVDCRSDFYALGHILKLLKLPRRFNHIIRRCLKPNPDDRYQNVMELQIAFQNTKEMHFSKWVLFTVVMGAIVTIGAFVIGNWVSQNVVKDLSTSRDKIIDGEMPAKFFGDKMEIHYGHDESYVVPNATTLYYKGNDKEIPGDISPTIAVDLGLSVKWAPFNVGCEEMSSNYVGGYYNWADPTGESTEGEIDTYDVPKYKTPIAGTKADIASVKWSNGWRMPTKDEFQELIDKCRWTLVNKRGSVQGYLVTGPSGKSIFLPFGGSRQGVVHVKEGIYGYYWTGTPYETPRYPAGYFMFLDDQAVMLQGEVASSGFNVRPVRE
ncbi:MAG: protein kinase [Bacteroidales bacterium]|nr:protein kinase [Bacteroidales bacterium]